MGTLVRGWWPLQVETESPIKLPVCLFSLVELVAVVLLLALVGSSPGLLVFVLTWLTSVQTPQPPTGQSSGSIRTFQQVRLA